MLNARWRYSVSSSDKYGGYIWRTRYIDVAFARLTVAVGSRTHVYVRDPTASVAPPARLFLSALSLGVATVWWGAFLTRKRGNCEYIATWSCPSHSALSRFNFEVVEVHCRTIVFLLLIHYFTLWSWPLTFGLEHLQCIARDMMKLCTKFERNRAIRGGLRFKYLTQWPNLNVL